jgi:F-type H+-transporting ATPase subunit gamma
MPSLKELRNRIASVKATQKITKAMQMVAAAKLRRAQEAAEAARPYAERMGRVLANIAASVEGLPSPPALIAGTGSDKVRLLVVCTAERGLAGAFNASIVRLAREDARRLLSEGKEVKILTVGKKGYDMLRREFEPIIVERIDFREVKRVSYGEAQKVAARVLEMFAEESFDVATLYYSRFRSVISQIPTRQRIIPAEVPEGQGEQQAQLNGAIYEYEPDEEEILAELLPLNIAVQIFRALLENAASEQGARMSAMDAATRNAGEMIDRLTLSYNRTRQAVITKELIEIISGAEAL